MKTVRQFNLKRAAKKSGGDRYESQLAVEHEPFVIYFPQFISRTVAGKVRESLTITIEGDGE